MSRDTIPDPLTDTSPWTLEYYREQRMKPISEILQDVIKDADLSITVHREVP